MKKVVCKSCGKVYRKEAGKDEYVRGEFCSECKNA
jgi:rubredoxin